MTIARDLSKILDANGDLTIDTSTLFVDSSTNRVGIGTTSPDELLDLGTSLPQNLRAGLRTYLGVGRSDGGSILGHSVKADTDAVSGSSPMIVTETNSGGGAPSAIRMQSGNIQFHTAGSGTLGATFDSERMRVDSSGNVLVGTTDTNPANNSTGNSTDNGFSIASDGRLFQASYQGTANSGSVQYVNRTGSDGDLIDLRKNGSNVISIGINGSVGYYQLYTPGQVAIRGGADDVRPCTNDGANRDNLTDLGDATVRWRNLYLGGELRIGGTGSANALDDYEEGTWTPTLQTNGVDFSSVGYSQRIGSYTKVGRLVVAPFFIQLNALTIGSPSGNLVITGLPFTSLSNTANKASIVAYISFLNYGLPGFSASNDSVNVGANVIHNTTTYQLVRTRNNNSADGIPYQALTSSSFGIVGTAIYDTN